MRIGYVTITKKMFPMTGYHFFSDRSKWRHQQWKDRSGAGKCVLSAYLKAFQSTSVGTFLVLPAKYLLTTHFQIKKESSLAHQFGKNILPARLTRMH